MFNTLKKLLLPPLIILLFLENAHAMQDSSDREKGDDALVDSFARFTLSPGSVQLDVASHENKAERASNGHLNALGYEVVENIIEQILKQDLDLSTPSNLTGSCLTIKTIVQALGDIQNLLEEKVLTLYPKSHLRAYLNHLKPRSGLSDRLKKLPALLLFERALRLRNIPGVDFFSFVTHENYNTVINAFICSPGDSTSVIADKRESIITRVIRCGHEDLFIGLGDDQTGDSFWVKVLETNDEKILNRAISLWLKRNMCMYPGRHDFIMLRMLKHQSTFTVKVLNRTADTMMNPLMAAAAIGNDGFITQMLEYLPLERTALIQLLSERNTMGATALLLATARGHRKTVEALLAPYDMQRVDDRRALRKLIACPDALGETPFSMAVRGNYTHIIHGLLSCYDRHNHEEYRDLVRLLELKDDQGLTPLMRASTCGHVDAVYLILNAYRNCSKLDRTQQFEMMCVRGQHGETALHRGANNDSENVARYLLHNACFHNAQGSFDYYNRQRLIAMLDDNGNTALICAISANNDIFMDELLAFYDYNNPADRHRLHEMVSTTNIRGANAFWVAASKGNLYAFGRILELFDLSVPEEKRKVHALLAAQIVSSSGVRGEGVLHWAVMHKSIEMVEAIVNSYDLTCRADREACSRLLFMTISPDVTALHIAVNQAQIEIVKRLLKSFGVDHEKKRAYCLLKTTAYNSSVDRRGPGKSALDLAQASYQGCTLMGDTLSARLFKDMLAYIKEAAQLATGLDDY